MNYEKLPLKTLPSREGKIGRPVYKQLSYGVVSHNWGSPPVKTPSKFFLKVRGVSTGSDPQIPIFGGLIEKN